MNEILEMIINGFFEHWAKVAVGAVLMAVGWVVGWYRARVRWQKKEFFGRINVSLNSVTDGKLRIRTIMEKSCEEVFLNQVAVRSIIDASQNTQPDAPVIPLPKDDYWFYLNAVLNEVSEKFSLGFLNRDAGRDVESHLYVICLTNECDGEIRTRKLRAMLIRADLFENLPEEMPELESPNHATRWRTLKNMAAAMEQHPHQFLKVELVI